MKKQIKKAKKQFKKRADWFVINFFASAIKPFSKFFRRVFEFVHIRRLVGALVVSSVFSITVLPVSLTNYETKIETKTSQVQVIDPNIVETETSIRVPVNNFVVSQGYSFFHPGVDLAAAKGSPVYPIMDGTVESVDRTRIGFGNYVVIDHGSGFKSLYAHMSKIEVKQGEKVDKNSIVGLVGCVGWSTGPPLHLQIWEEDHWANPKAFLEGYLGTKLASTR